MHQDAKQRAQVVTAKTAEQRGASAPERQGLGFTLQLASILLLLFGSE